MTKRKTCLIITALTLAAAAAAPAGQAKSTSVVAGGCVVQASAKLSGLTFTSQAFTYHYTGKLTRCAYTQPGAPKSGTIAAGEQIRINGKLYQEPIPSGTGSCLKTQTSGYDFARWADGTQTIVQFTTTGGGAAGTQLIGQIVPKLTLTAVGSKSTTVFETNRFLGQHAYGALSFHVPNPAVCSSTGVKQATITGILGHVGL